MSGSKPVALMAEEKRFLLTAQGSWKAGLSALLLSWFSPLIPQIAEVQAVTLPFSSNLHFVALWGLSVRPSNPSSNILC